MNTTLRTSATTNPQPASTVQAAPLSPAVRVTTVVAVVVVALIAAVVSYSHMQQLADRAGEAWRSYLIPLSIDGLVVAASMVLLARRRNGLPGGHLAWSALGGGVLASLAANMADARPETTAVLIAGWPAVAFAVAFELLLQQRRAEGRELNPEPAPVTPPPTVEPFCTPGPVVHTPVAAAPAEPAPQALPVPQAAPSPVATRPTTADPLDTRLRDLIRRTGKTPGRRTVARELGITEHQARAVLDRVTAPTSEQASLNGVGGGPR